MVLMGLFFASSALTLAFQVATYIFERNVSASSALVGWSVGLLLGLIAYHLINGAPIRRMAFGILGVIASTVIVLDITGQFMILDGTAHWIGAGGIAIVIGAILASRIANDEYAAGVLYLFAGVACVAVATIGLYLEWTQGHEVVGSIAPSELGLVLFSGLVVWVIGMRTWDDVPP